MEVVNKTYSDDANSLVDQLSGNFAAEGKRSCRDCLRSKAMPSQRVVGITEKMEQQLSEDLLLGAHSIVQQRLAALLSNTDGSASCSRTALSHMDTIATAIRYIQLLLYLAQISESKEKQRQRQPLAKNQSSNMPVVVQAPSSPLSPDRIDQLLHKLLENVVQATAGLLSSYHDESSSSSSRMDDDDKIDPMTSDTSSSPYPRPVACFAFLSILRLHQFCKRRQQWMISLCKSLCDLASAAKKANASLPLPLIEDAIRIMTKLLDEGTLVLTNHAASRWMPRSTSSSTTTAMLALDQHIFFAKFLSFLVLRIATLLSLLPFGKGVPLTCQPGNNHSPTTALCKILTTLRGLPLAIRWMMSCWNTKDHSQDPEDDSFLQNYDSIASKIDKQFLRVVLGASSTRTNKVGSDKKDAPSSCSAPQQIHSGLLLSLLEMKISKRLNRSNGVSSDNDTGIQDLLRHGRVLGQALLLQRILHKVSSDSTTTSSLSMEDADVLLKSCECYHSVVLPQCFGFMAAGMYGSCHNSTKENTAAAAVAASMEPFLTPMLSSLTTLLLRIEKSMSFDTDKRAQLHRLLIRWMAPTIMVEANGIGAAKKEVHHGATLAMLHPISQEFVLSLIYMYVMTNDKITIPPPLVKLMVKLLFDARTSTALRCNISILMLRLQASSRSPAWMRALYTLIEKEFAELWKHFSAKHNRKRKRKRRGFDARPHAFRIYNEKDVEAIGRVLAKHSTNNSPLLREAIRTFVREDVLKLLGQKRLAVQIKSISLLLWYMHSGMIGSDSSVVIPASQTILVMKRILEHLLVQITTPATWQNLSNNFPLIVASLSLCRALCSNTATTELTLPILGLCQFVSACTSEPFLRPPSKAQSGEPEVTRLLRYRVLFGGIDLLGSMGTVIPDSCPTHALETIRDVFLRIFSVQALNITCPALSALIKFGQNVSSAHTHVLSTFLPKNKIPLFQARSQGMIWKNSSHYEIDNSLDSFEKLGEALKIWIQRRSLEKSIFLAVESYKIVLGSFFLQLPTRDGRQALVIFPPGETSLDDIRHMYELRGEEELPQVQTLTRVLLAGAMADEGCNCILSTYHY